MSNMSFAVTIRCLTAITIVLVIVNLMHSVEGTYRKPPFNGSIFGKRGTSTIAEYDSAGKALSSLCEIASEACQAWFPAQDK